MRQFTGRPTTIITDYLCKHNKTYNSLTRTEINCNNVLHKLTTYSSTSLIENTYKTDKYMQKFPREKHVEVNYSPGSIFFTVNDRLFLSSTIQIQILLL